MFNYRKNVSFITDIFTKVSENYDLMNDVMSFGIHRIWKSNMLSHVINAKGKVLDVATGTGDIALSIAKRSRDLRVVSYDINYDMMKICKGRAINLNLLNLDYSCGNADALPFSDNIFDYYLVAFGIRNVVNRMKALDEAYRVLNFGGKFICLEFSPSENCSNYIVRSLYNFYSSNIIPKMGEIIARNREAYEYLVESIRLFPKNNDFKSEIEKAGFCNVSNYSMSCGIVSMHTGWKML